MTTQINDIFFPVFSHDSTEYKHSGNPFAYYTDAGTALQIIRNQCIWLRKPSMMNDYSEIEHGIDCLGKALISTEGLIFRDVLNSLHNGICDEIDQIFTYTVNTIRTSTFIACFTKHISTKEDNIGRLSMWRAYGKSNGIALIFKPDIFFNNYSAMQTGVINSPVAYFTTEKIQETFNLIAANIHRNMDIVKAYPRQELQNLILNVYSMAVMCNKHYGFEEEREWRVMTYPPLTNASPFITQRVELINGTPQKIQSFNFKMVPGIPDLTLQNLLQKIIIGPCSHPLVTKDALAEELYNNGFHNPNDMIHISNIPLRHN